MYPGLATNDIRVREWHITLDGKWGWGRWHLPATLGYTGQVYRENIFIHQERGIAEIYIRPYRWVNSPLFIVKKNRRVWIKGSDGIEYDLRQYTPLPLPPPLYIPLEIRKWMDLSPKGTILQRI